MKTSPRNIPISVLITCMLVLLGAPALQLAAADGDWGLTLDMDTRSRIDNEDWDEPVGSFAFTSALWGRLFFSDPSTPRSATYELATQGSYTFTDERPYLFDVDLLRLTGSYPALMGEQSVLEASAGRFRFSDSTGRVISHLADGGRLRLRFPAFNMRLDAAYTGLQLDPNSDIRLTGADFADIDDEFFGPARAVGIAEFVFPELLGPHTVRLGVTGQYDLRDAETGEDTYHSGYYTLALEGPVAGGLYYNASGTLMQGTEDTKDGDSVDELGILGIARLRYFRESLLFSRLSLAGIYASADEGEFSPFRSISGASVGTVFSRPVSDLIYAEAGYSLRPFANSGSAAARAVQTALTLRSFFSATEPEAAAADGQWYGNEVTLNIAARLFSDFGLALTGGVFLPMTDEEMGILGKDADPQYLGKLELSAAL
jgi:hypothetical protein